MRSRLILISLAILVLVGKIYAQPLKQAAVGRIVGHVLLGDSGLPARDASVSLVLAKDPRLNPRGQTATTNLAQVYTLMDGSFTITRLSPGDYYLIAEKAGYISAHHLPFGSLFNLSHEEWASMASLLTPVAVSAEHTTAVEVTLTKGATITGSVRFDDGSPDAEAPVSMFRKESTGRWTPYPTAFFSIRSDGAILTDDLGNFRFSGLPAGEYLVKALVETGRGVVRNNQGDSLISYDYDVDIYYGGGSRPKDAKPIKLVEGELSGGVDIEIPLSRFFSVSGTVVSAENRIRATSGRVELHYADDDSIVSAVDIDSDGGQFLFPFVPRGDYAIKVNCSLDASIMHDRLSDKKQGNCGSASQAIIVNGSISGLVIETKP